MGKAIRLFNGAAEQTLYSRIAPTAEQRDFLQAQWNALADYLKSYLHDKHGYPISTWIQGSYKFGTLIKPVHLGEEYDVDLGIYFEWESDQGAEPAPEQLREWVQQALVEYGDSCADIREVVEPPKERCSRAIYQGQFHIDTPVYHLDREKDKRRLACLPGSWENKDPKPIYKWFKNVVSEDDRDQLRRLIRYMKGWAAVAFKDAEKSRPSSILLTVLIAEAYQDLWMQRVLGIHDDDALIEVIKKIHARLFRNKQVPNPIDRHEDLNRIHDDDWQACLTRLQALRDASEKAAEADDEASAAFAWSEVFSFLMPLPEAEEVEIIDESSGRAVMNLPEIEIDVFTGYPRRFVAKYRNEVPGVAKNCELVFRIVNPEIVPEFATIEWTVRNGGGQADHIGDLGHRNGGIRMFTMQEHTAYQGRHYMDCTVRHGGSVYAVRRIPVDVRNVQAALRNPPKPAYTKLTSRLRRRR